MVVQVEAVATNDGSNMKGNAAKALEFAAGALSTKKAKAHQRARPAFLMASWWSPVMRGASGSTRMLWAKAPKATEDALSRRFRRAATELKEGGSIGECGQWVWLDMDKAGHGQN